MKTDGEASQPGPASADMRERRLILMISIGQRGWVPATAALFERYARRCGADFRLQTSLPKAGDFPLPVLPDRPGRPHKRVYACKAFLPWQAMAIEGYDRVLVVDDSCCVKPDAPNIFDYAPAGTCGYTETSHAHAERSFETIRAFLRKLDLADIDYDPARYMNSGVMLYDRSIASALAPDRIIAARDLLFAAYPHQTLTYFLLISAGVRMTMLPKAFNRLPAADRPPAEWATMTDVAPFIGPDDNTFIYHVTGAFQRRNVVIPSLAMDLLRQTDPMRAAELGPSVLRRAPPPRRATHRMRDWLMQCMT